MTLLREKLILNDMKVNANYALVTGRTSGIGYELVKLLAADGYNLIIVARHEIDLIRLPTRSKKIMT